MNFANFIPAILGILGLRAFHKVDGHESLSAEECEKLKEYGFKDRFLQDFNAYLANPKDSAKGDDGKKMAAVAAVLAQTTEQLQARTSELEALKKSVAKSNQDHGTAIEAKETEISALKEKIDILSDLPDSDNASGSVKPEAKAAPFNLNDTKQLGGMPGIAWGLDRAYNQRARAALLAARGYEVAAVASPQSVDYEQLKADLGAFYRQPWSDRLQSFLAVLPAIQEVFPTESGHQDLDTLTNIWLGEFSQADSSDSSDFEKVAKGSYEFGTETLRMYGVMFVHIFRSLKGIEKSWIGYLNREGSDPVKLSLIEYLLVETAKALHNEQQLRFVNGVRKDPDPNVPGRAMGASDGIYEYIRKRVEGHVDFTPNGGTTGRTVYQIKPFELPEITPGNIGEVFYLGTSMVPSVFRDTNQLVLYVPSFMMAWYHRYNELKYGQNTDYKGAVNCVKEYPSVRIVPIPNADNHHRIFWTIDGNIKTYEHLVGEMIQFKIELQDWKLKVWSNWKESIQAEAVGYKYTDPADMDGSRQMIWCNQYDRPVSYFLESDKDEQPSALLHSSIVTVANSSVLAITDIKDAAVGQTVTLKCGAGDESGVKIEKKDKFSLISSDWVPKKGDTITLMKREDGKFIELGRASSAAGSYQFPADETAPSVKGATVFITGENTQATAITDLADAIPGKVYTIHGCGDKNASTIASGGAFVLTAAMTLKAGSMIKIVKGEDGKFYEVSRG